MPVPDAPEAPPVTDAPAAWAERLEQLRRDPRVVAAVLVAVVIAAAVVWMRAGSGEESPIASTVTTSAAPAASTTSPPRKLVHVAGAVRAPGVVELEPGGRVRDAIVAAGGPADDADVARLNLAAPVADGERVAVPRIGEPDPVAAFGDAPAGGSATPNGPLNLNTATARDLEELPGIGPVLAEAIIKERERVGGFDAVDDLKQVRGIGEQRFADIRDLVAV
jgi:competence protein ComEA